MREKDHGDTGKQGIKPNKGKAGDSLNNTQSAGVTNPRKKGKRK